MTSGRSPGPGPRQPVVSLPRALWGVWFQRCALAERMKMLFSLLFPIFQFLRIYSRTELWSITLCDLTSISSGSQGVDLAFSLDAIVDTLHTFIVALVLFSLGRKRWFLLAINRLLEISWQVVPYSQSLMCGWKMKVSSTAQKSCWP